MAVSSSRVASRISSRVFPVTVVAPRSPRQRFVEVAGIVPPVAVSRWRMRPTKRAEAHMPLPFNQVASSLLDLRPSHPEGGSRHADQPTLMKGRLVIIIPRCGLVDDKTLAYHNAGSVAETDAFVKRHMSHAGTRPLLAKPGNHLLGKAIQWLLIIGDPG